MIERRRDGRFLGRTGIWVVDSRTWTHASVAEAGPFAQPELGWALVRAEWGHGYATEAASAAATWVRTQRNVDRLMTSLRPTTSPL